MAKALFFLSLIVAANAAGRTIPVQVQNYAPLTGQYEGEVRRIYDTIFTPQYQPSLRPVGVNGSSDGPTYFYLNFTDVDVIRVDEQRGLFTFQGLTTQYYFDPRLSFTSESVNYVPLSTSFKDSRRVWHPSIYYPRGVEHYEYPGSVFSGQYPRSLRVYNDGRVVYYTRFSQTIYCPALYTAKPGQQFNCPVQIGAFGYLEGDVRLFFTETGVTRYTGYEDLPGYRFDNVATYPVGGDQNNFLQFNFTFTRV